MDPQTFVIKSLFVQNTIMLVALSVVLFFLFRSLIKRQGKHILLVSLWLLIVLWFFNSSFFGFSAVTVAPRGIRVNYGILSFRNGWLPLDTPWKIEGYMGGIRRMEQLYYLKIDGQESMKVKGGADYELLKRIGNKIEKMKAEAVR